MRFRQQLSGSRPLATVAAGATIFVALVLTQVLTSPSQHRRTPKDARASLQKLPLGTDSPERAEAATQDPADSREPPHRAHRTPRAHEIHWRQSQALGLTYSGSLKRGVMLPSEGRTWVSWDPVERDKPNRWWRRWGTDDLVRTTLATVRAYAGDHPRASRVLIGDMSRPHGGDFGARFGSIGHVSHQNGLDVDVYYPRRDRREWPARLPEQVDARLAQDLVDRFVAAGAEKVFVGPNLPLTGPPGIVVPLDHHDDHLHFRLAAAAAR